MSSDVLQGPTLKPFLSDYLSFGYQEDVVSYQSIEMTASSARTRFSLPGHYTPADGHYHLTVPTAFMVVAQTAIAWAHWRQDLPEKTVEVWLTRFDIRCGRPVLESIDLTLDLHLTSERQVSSGTFYSGAVNVADGAFVGKSSFFMPSPSA